MARSRRILIVGCGAIGGIFAASLAYVAEIVAYDANEAHVRAIRERGLRVSGAAERLARIAATASAAELAGRFDALFFLIKSSATASALRQLNAVMAGRPLLVTLQNGMGNTEALLSAGDCPVARGVTTDAGRYAGPGHVEHLIRGKTWLGPIRGDMDDVRWLGALLTEAGLPAEIVADPMDAVWSKFVFNSVMNPIGALLLGVNAARYEAREVCALIDEMAAECERVVHALGGRFAYDPLEYVKKVRAGQAPLSKHAGSMAQDIARGAPTEIDELTGFIVREGERLGIPVPACKTVWRLVKGLEIAARHRRP